MTSMAQMRPIAIVLLLAALAYLLYLWSKRRDQINCPSCGANVNMYADQCPHCGHEKGEPVEEETTGEDEDYEKEVVDEDEDVAEEPAEEEAAEEQASEEEEPEGEYTCDECGQSFDSERGLNIHTGMKH